MSRFLPPSKITNSAISRSILGDGCVVRSGCKVHHSVLGVRALINEGCTVEDSLIMGADYYETLEECALIPGCLAMGLGGLLACKPAIVSSACCKLMRACITTLLPVPSAAFLCFCTESL